MQAIDRRVIAIDISFAFAMSGAGSDPSDIGTDIIISAPIARITDSHAIGC